MYVSFLTADSCTIRHINFTQDRQVYVATSPHFPLTYPENLQCIWFFKSVKPLGFFVLKTGEVFKLDIFDGLSLGKTNVISPSTTLYRFPRFFGYVETIEYTIDILHMYKLIDDNTFWLRFVSDNYGSSDGFYAFIEWRNTSGNDNP